VENNKERGKKTKRVKKEQIRNSIKWWDSRKGDQKPGEGGAHERLFVVGGNNIEGLRPRVLKSAVGRGHVGRNDGGKWWVEKKKP